MEKGKFLLIYLCTMSRVIVNKGNKGIELKKRTIALNKGKNKIESQK